LFAWLKDEAATREYGKKRAVFLADGSEHINQWDDFHRFIAKRTPRLLAQQILTRTHNAVSQSLPIAA
jgi:hypothetical protein